MTQYCQVSHAQYHYALVLHEDDLLQQDDTEDIALDFEIYWIYFCNVTAVLGMPLLASSL